MTDWRGMNLWLEEKHPRILGFLWNTYYRYEKRHNHIYYERTTGKKIDEG